MSPATAADAVRTLRSAWLWVLLDHQQSGVGSYVSLDDLVVMLAFPFLFVGVIAYVMEDLLGRPEYQSGAVSGGILLVIGLTAGPGFDRGVARALWREFGWQVGFQVEHPLTLFWGGWGVLVLLGAIAEYQEQEPTTGG